MQLSVIILNYNVCFFLEQCVLSVQNAVKNLDAEIIVVDNNSSDDSCKMIQSKFPEVILIENTENFGFPKGNNIGVEIAKGEYICVLNPDTVVAEDTMEKVLNFAKNTLNIGITGCKLIDGTGNFLPESKRGVPTPWVAFTKVFGLYKLFPKNKLFNKYYALHVDENQTGKVDILVGAFMLMKKSHYQDLGGFDEACFMYSDDIDLSFLSLKSQKDNYYFHESTIIHYKGESTIRDHTYMKRFQDAMQFFYKKHFKRSILFSIMMQTGILFFSIIKMFQGKKVSNQKPLSYILVSDDLDLKEKLQKKLQKSIELFSQKELKELLSQTISKNTHKEIIFDNHQMDFKIIISFMEQLKNSGFTFKIHPKNTNFIIGSNHSNDRGEVVFL